MNQENLIYMDENSSFSSLSSASVDVRTLTTSNRFNPLDGVKPDAFIRVLESLKGVKVSENDKQTLRYIMHNLLPSASIEDLVYAFNQKEAAKLGITLQQYDDLFPLIQIIQQMDI